MIELKDVFERCYREEGLAKLSLSKEQCNDLFDCYAYYLLAAIGKQSAKRRAVWYVDQMRKVGPKSKPKSNPFMKGGSK